MTDSSRSEWELDLGTACNDSDPEHDGSESAPQPPITSDLRNTLDRCGCITTDEHGVEVVNVSSTLLWLKLDAIDAIHEGLEHAYDTLDSYAQATSTENDAIRKGISDSVKAEMIDTYVNHIASLESENEKLREEYAVAMENWNGCIEEISSLKSEIDSLEALGAADWAPMTEENMSKHGWLRMPTDADGNTIRVGDHLEHKIEGCFCVEAIDYGKHCMHHDGYGWMVWGEGSDVYVRADECRACPSNSVESVLRQFASDFDDIGGKPDEDELWDKLLSDYVPRLRLVGDDE